MLSATTQPAASRASSSQTDVSPRGVLTAPSPKLSTASQPPLELPEAVEMAALLTHTHTHTRRFDDKQQLAQKVEDKYYSCSNTVVRHGRVNSTSAFIILKHNDRLEIFGVCMVPHIARVWINRVPARGQLNREN